VILLALVRRACLRRRRGWLQLPRHPEKNPAPQIKAVR